MGEQERTMQSPPEVDMIWTTISSILWSQNQSRVYTSAILTQPRIMVKGRYAYRRIFKAFWQLPKHNWWHEVHKWSYKMYSWSAYLLFREYLISEMAAYLICYWSHRDRSSSWSCSWVGRGGCRWTELASFWHSCFGFWTSCPPSHSWLKTCSHWQRTR